MRPSHTAIAAALLTLAMAQAAQAAPARSSRTDCRAKDLTALAGWSGVWIAQGLETGINGRNEAGKPVDPRDFRLLGLDAPWNDEGWSRFETVLLASQKGRIKQSGGWGFPMMMASHAPFNFVISPGETVITSQYREIRYVYTDGRGHPREDDLWPTTWGDSTGCWQGRTLVIDTIDAKYSAEFNAFAPPLSDQAHFVERIRLVAPGRMEADVTITDPTTLERPWNTKITFVHPKGIDRLVQEGDFLENDRSLTDDGSGAIAPPRERASPAPPKDPYVQLTEADIDRVAGDYAFDGPPLRLKTERRGHKLFMEVLPAQPFWLPMHARSALDFEFAGVPLHFTADATGDVTGFTGTQADGTPISGKRLKEASR